MGVGLFVDENGSTTVAAAVAVLVSLVLVFGLASSEWTLSRSADVQVVADAGALAGANVVASYATAAQVLDALVLSLGLIGMLTFAIGLVLSAIPLVSVAGPPVLEAAQSVFSARSKLARSAAGGLQKLEGALPYMVAANSLLTVRANARNGVGYVGVAVPYPLEGSSDFGMLDTDDMEEQIGDLRERGEEIDGLTKRASESKEQADSAAERGWRADCGDDPSMCERAEALAGLQGVANPFYPTSEGWDFGVPVLRARAYYRERLAREAPLDASVAEATRSAARKAFYAYALQEVNASSFVEYADGSVSCDLHMLPANTAEVRDTALYTDALWPCTVEEGGPTIHSYAGCPGATGSPTGLASVASEETGACVECPVCRFTVVDLGRAPAASTSVDNGFEHHWRIVVEASREYERARSEQARLEEEAREASQRAIDLFDQALRRLTAVRVTLSPPGRYGCVCVTAGTSGAGTPQSLRNAWNPGASLPARVAISGAALARDEGVSGGNVLADFFDGLVARGGLVGGASSVLDGVMTAWGGMLEAYEDGYRAFSGTMESAFRRLSAMGLGGVSTWLKEALNGVVSLAAVEPADLTAKKPVLVNTADIMGYAGNDWYAAVRAMAMAVQAVGVDAGPSVVLGALGIFVETLTGSSKLVIAEVGIPGTELSIPIEVDLEWLAALGEAA